MPSGVLPVLAVFTQLVLFVSTTPTVRKIHTRALSHFQSRQSTRCAACASCGANTDLGALQPLDVNVRELGQRQFHARGRPVHDGFPCSASEHPSPLTHWLSSHSKAPRCRDFNTDHVSQLRYATVTESV